MTPADALPDAVTSNPTATAEATKIDLMTFKVSSF